jgi:hypothetical protein
MDDVDQNISQSQNRAVQALRWNLVCQTDQRGNGILWVNAAGNYGQGYRQEVFTAGVSPDLHEFTLPDTTTTNSLAVTHSGAGGVYNDRIILSRGGTNPTVDLELEVVREDGSLYEPQVVELTLQRIYWIRLSEPFSIRVRSVGDTPANNVATPFNLYIGKAVGMGSVGATSPVIAPGDATRVLTVGALDGNNVAAYSSRNTNTGELKPDLLAPGEVTLTDGTTFIGTSAASPIVAGVAALLRQEDETRTSDQLIDFFQTSGRGVIVMGDGPSPNFGHGRLNIPAPPDPPGAAEEIVYGNDVESIFPSPTPNPTDVPGAQGCAAGLLHRLLPGMRGYILAAPPIANSMREGPGRNFRSLTRSIQPDERFTVLDGPICANGWNYYEVELEDGTIGWTPEGGDYYWAAPVLLRNAEYPRTFADACPRAPVTNFEIGQEAVVDFNQSGELLVTGNPSGQTSLDDILTEYRDDHRVYILGGPVCAQRGDRWRWYVRSMENGTEGWITEGEAGDAFICPLSNPECGA